MFVFRSEFARPRASPSHGQTNPSLEQTSGSQEQASADVESLPGLRSRVTVIRDIYGVPHVKASNDHDAYFTMGYLHAEDRFFQMDYRRHLGSGTVAELLGAGPEDQFLSTDVLNRFLGIKRSAERSLSAYSPATIALLQAYSDGVNAWLDSNTLPTEYPALEITRVERWRPIDSLTILKLIQFQTTFDTADLDNTEALLQYQEEGQAKSRQATLAHLMKL
jgi:penicillin G amidase